MQKRARGISAWWASPVFGLVFCLMSEAFAWGYFQAAPFVPSLREGEGDVFIRQSGSIRPFEKSPLVIGRRMDREQEMERWESLPPEERREMRRRMERWKELSPQDQQLLRQRHRQWQELKPEERQRMKENLREWDALSPQDQERIRKRFRTP